MTHPIPWHFVVFLVVDFVRCVATFAFILCVSRLFFPGST